MSVKICSKCKSPKDLKAFNVDNSRKDKRQPYCNECRKNMAAVRYKQYNGISSKRPRDIKYCPRCEENKFSSSFNKSEWSIDGRQSYCRMCSKIRLPKYKEARNKVHKIKRTTDPQFKLSMNLRTRISRAIRHYKSGSAVRDLGCTLQELKTHLESKFLPGMSWDNWGRGKGKWNIDHIIPLCKFNLENRQHFLLAANYLNLQPLWFEDNLAKSGNY